MSVTTLLTEEAALGQGLATQHHVQCRASLGLTDTPPALLARIRPSELPPTPKQLPSLNGNLLPVAPGFASDSKSLRRCIQKSLAHVQSLTVSQSSPFTGWTVPALSQFLDLSPFQVLSCVSGSDAFPPGPRVFIHSPIHSTNAAGTPALGQALCRDRGWNTSKAQGSACPQGALGPEEERRRTNKSTNTSHKQHQAT